MLLDILLQAGGGLNQFIPILLVLVVMYMFFIRPQMKKQKEERLFRDEITKGMRVVTGSGIHGKVLEVKDNIVIIESENSRLKMEISAVSKEMSAVYLNKEKDKKDDKK